MTDEEFKLLKHLSINDNKPIFDLVQTKIYREKCIKEFNYDPLPDVKWGNVPPRYYTNYHWVAKFEWLYRQELKKIQKKKLKELTAKIERAAP